MIVMRVTSVSFLLSASVLKERKKSSGPYSLSVLAFLLSPLLCVPLVALASVGSGLPFSSCPPSFSFPFFFQFFFLFSPAFFVFSGFIATEFHRYQVINQLLLQE
ncbi:hypothetical protein POPTR_012G071450v4 [Populus trichocarpa]|uniref:Uncharacterized protein n=1 Tax=Populus trichocarpa TaxID=3694 RepID=A0ACC0S5Y9_POPTR|nr:hypothetical protein POPTR_012G071450v4 [Populus trichocarpa]